MCGNEFSEPFDFGLPGIDSGFDSRDIAADDDGHVTAAEFFFGHDFDVGGFAGGIDGFEDGGEALGFDKAEGLVGGICHGVVAPRVGIEGGRLGTDEDGLLEEGAEFGLAEDASLKGGGVGMVEDGCAGVAVHGYPDGGSDGDSGLDRIDGAFDFENGAEEVVEFCLNDVNAGTFLHGVEGDHSRGEAGDFKNAESH